MKAIGYAALGFFFRSPLKVDSFSWLGRQNSVWGLACNQLLNYVVICCVILARDGVVNFFDFIRKTCSVRLTAAARGPIVHQLNFLPVLSILRISFPRQQPSDRRLFRGIDIDCLAADRDAYASRKRQIAAYAITRISRQAFSASASLRRVQSDLTKLNWTGLV